MPIRLNADVITALHIDFFDADDFSKHSDLIKQYVSNIENQVLNPVICAKLCDVLIDSQNSDRFIWWNIKARCLVGIDLYEARRLLNKTISSHRKYALQQTEDLTLREKLPEYYILLCNLLADKAESVPEQALLNARAAYMLALLNQPHTLITPYVRNFVNYCPHEALQEACSVDLQSTNPLYCAELLNLLAEDPQKTKAFVGTLKGQEARCLALVNNRRGLTACARIFVENCPEEAQREAFDVVFQKRHPLYCAELLNLFSENKNRVEKSRLKGQEAWCLALINEEERRLTGCLRIFMMHFFCAARRDVKNLALQEQNPRYYAALCQYFAERDHYNASIWRAQKELCLSFVNENPLWIDCEQICFKHHLGQMVEHLNNEPLRVKHFIFWVVLCEMEQNFERIVNLIPFEFWCRRLGDETGEYYFTKLISFIHYAIIHQLPGTQRYMDFLKTVILAIQNASQHNHIWEIPFEVKQHQNVWTPLALLVDILYSGWDNMAVNYREGLIELLQLAVDRCSSEDWQGGLYHQGQPELVRTPIALLSMLLEKPGAPRILAELVSAIACKIEVVQGHHNGFFSQPNLILASYRKLRNFLVEPTHETPQASQVVAPHPIF